METAYLRLRIAHIMNYLLENYERDVCVIRVELL